MAAAEDVTIPVVVITRATVAAAAAVGVVVMVVVAVVVVTVEGTHHKLGTHTQTFPANELQTSPQIRLVFCHARNAN